MNIDERMVESEKFDSALQQVSQCLDIPFVTNAMRVVLGDKNGNKLKYPEGFDERYNVNMVQLMLNQPIIIKMILLACLNKLKIVN